MFRIRTLRPDNGYCLFFPNRKVGKRFIAGQKVSVGLFEECKHIKLGQFGVILPEPNNNTKDLITTCEGMECNVKADFKIVVGGSEEGREDRLNKATNTCPAARNPNKIELDFFKNWATNYCKNSIKRIVRECEYIKIIEDTQYRADAEKKIGEDLKNNLAGIGLILVESTVVIEPQEPKSATVTQEIINKWLEFQKTLNNAAIAKLKADSQKEVEIAELRQEEKVKEIERASLLKNNEWRIEIEEKEKYKEKEDAIRKIQEQLDSWTKEAKLNKIKMQSEVDEAEQIAKIELEIQMRKNEQESYEHKLKILGLEKQSKEKELEFSALKGKLASLEMEMEKVKEQARIEFLEKENLAKDAHKFQMRKALLEALPKILIEANKPLEKMGKIHTMQFIGSPNEGGQKNLTEGLLASASTLPLIKEVIRFVKEFSESEEKNE